MGGYADALMGNEPASNVAPAKNKYSSQFFEEAYSADSHPVASAGGPAGIIPINDPSRMAGVVTQAGASLPTDTLQKIKFFASQRFPDMPINDAMSHYGMEGGRLFYIDPKDKKAYYEEPSLSLSPTEQVKNIASGAGPALPMIGGMAGGVAGGPMGGVPAAMAGAAGGDVVRQGLSSMVTGSGYSPMQTTEEGVLGGVGQGIGKAFVSLMDRKAVRDVGKFISKEGQEAADAIIAKAREFGIDLTPAEITGLNSLKGQQNVLQDLPASADIMGDFLKNRSTVQIPDAVQSVLDKISSVQSREVGAKRLQQGATDVIKGAKAERQAMAGPMYEEAFKANQNVVSKDVDKILSTPAGQRALSSAREKMLNDMSLMGVPDAELAEQAKLVGSYKPGGIASGLKLRTLDYVKRSLDDQIGAAQRAGANDEVRILTGLKNKLVSTLDEADVTAKAGPKSMKPEGGLYAQGRAAYAGKSPEVAALEGGEIGLVAGKKPTQLRAVPKAIFESGPESIAANRAAFKKAGRLEDWNAGLRAHLSDSFNKASKEYVSGGANPGAKFRAMVYGTPEQRRALQAAMEPEQVALFNKLMDVLEASGRVPQGGSRTALAQEAIGDMRSKAGAIGKTVLNPARVLRGLSNTYEDLMLGKHAENLAEIITMPKGEGVKLLKQLRRLPPRSAKAAMIVSQLFTQYGVAQAGDALSPQSAAPGSYKIQNPQ